MSADVDFLSPPPLCRDGLLFGTAPQAQKQQAKTDRQDAESLSSEESDRRIRSAYFPDAGGWLETEIIRRSDLTPGQDIQGPSIVEDPDATIVVPPGDTIERTPRGHLLIRIDTGESS